jgi:hypothetical protein
MEPSSGNLIWPEGPFKYRSIQFSYFYVLARWSVIPAIDHSAKSLLWKTGFTLFVC